MTNEIAQYNAPAEIVSAEPNAAIGQLMQHAQAMGAAYELASKLSNTTLVPQMYQKKPDEATAAILYGAELGLNPIQSLQQIFVVQGKPAIYARTMVALVKTKGYLIETVESTDESVTVRGTDPRTGVVETSTWTVERAKKAGYTSNKKYDTDPQGMLYAKSATEVCRKLAPEVLLGIAYSREELELERPIQAVAERVQAGPKRGTAGLAERLGVTSEPTPATSEPADEDPTKPTTEQLKHLNALLEVEKLSTKQAKLDWLEGQFGRKFTSAADLKFDEAQELINFLTREQSADEAKAAQA